MEKKISGQGVLKVGGVGENTARLAEKLAYLPAKKREERLLGNRSELLGSAAISWKKNGAGKAHLDVLRWV